MPVAAAALLVGLTSVISTTISSSTTVSSSTTTAALDLAGHHDELPPPVAAPQTWLSGSSRDNRQFVKLDGPGEEAACLDGSPFAFYVWPGNSSEWSIFINGGGWCLTEKLCQARAATALGSSLGYNASGAWDPPSLAGPGVGGPPAYTCQGLDPNCTRVFLPYCDGSCFTSYRAAPWPVNSRPSGANADANASLTFRGLTNLDRTLDVLEERFGLGSARRVVLQGGSAGGLSTYIHLDRVADRVKAAAAAAADFASVGVDVVTQQHQQPEQAPEPIGRAGSAHHHWQQQASAPTQPRSAEAAGTASASTTVGPPPPAVPEVVGRPVAGFFIDEPKFNPAQPSYAANIKYGVAMFNSTPPLPAACKAAYPAAEAWRCWMAPYVAPFVRERIFAVQSRFDEFQLQCLLAVPCCQGQSYAPPYRTTSCNASELSAVKSFGAALLEQMQPFLKAKPESGTWLVSCIQHNVNCDMFNTTEEEAFSSWLVGGALGKDRGYRWIDDCGAQGDGSTPCEKGQFCAPPHF